MWRKLCDLVLVRLLRPPEDDSATPMLHRVRVVLQLSERSVSATAKAKVTGGIQTASRHPVMQISDGNDRCTRRSEHSSAIWTISFRSRQLVTQFQRKTQSKSATGSCDRGTCPLAPGERLTDETLVAGPARRAKMSVGGRPGRPANLRAACFTSFTLAVYYQYSTNLPAACTRRS